MIDPLRREDFEERCLARINGIRCDRVSQRTCPGCLCRLCPSCDAVHDCGDPLGEAIRDGGDALIRLAAHGCTVAEMDRESDHRRRMDEQARLGAVLRGLEARERSRGRWRDSE